MEAAAMKAALTIWNERISPVFDTAVSILLVDIEDQKCTPCGNIDLCDMSPNEKVHKLKTAGVEVLICGAVSNLFARLLTGENIDLVPWVSGKTDAVLDAFARGGLGPTKFLMPGCSRRRCGQGNNPGSERPGRGMGGPGMGQGRGNGRGAGTNRRRRKADADSNNIDRTD
jgi:predicted Fe-Mo cluster-binding NifX family protein